MSNHIVKIRLNSHPVIVEFDYIPGVPFRQTGWGAGDCDPPEHEEVSLDSVTTPDGYEILKYLSDAQCEEIEQRCIDFMGYPDE